MTSMENVSQTLQDMRLEAKEYHNQQIGAISKRLDVQAGSLDLNTSQQVLDAIRSLTFKIADQQSWPRTSTIQIAAHLDPETRSCSIDHSGTSCGDQGRIKRIEDELSDQKQQLQLLTGKFGELQLSGSQPQENGNIIEQDVQETIQHSIQALFGFFRTRTDALFLKLWIILPVVQHVFRNLQAPRLFVSLTIGESIVFEDVLGRVVHLPYKDFRHYTVFIERLRCEFEGKPGKNEVLMNQFHIFRHGQCDQFLTQENWNVGIRPGSRIAMSIVLDIHYGGEDKCPRCKATETNLGTNGILQWYAPAIMSESMLIMRSTACGLNWALQKLDPPYTSSRRLYSEEATSDLPLPQNIRNMEENEQYSSSAPLPDSSGGSSHSVDNKDIEKFRMVHVEKRDPSAYMDATSSIASYLETIGFTLKGSFPWKPSYKGITVKSALMEAMQNVPSYMLEHDGLMYIFWCKSSSKILKIGTTRNVTRLFAECTRCCGPAYRYDRKLYSGEEMRLPFAHIVETLVHIELSDYHLHVECWKHRIKHFGHFYVSKSHAMRVIQKWKRWILQDPYMRNADGQWVLKPPFKAQVAEMCRPLAMEN
ncbi:hypothetical protein yc1106_04027 [Curvularia clavata]|uniref:Uncharacterized protein n=1 Tax=Curvularia clavata TaxID=95742 RepID=A0A9Q8Z9I5_CURCL|nr:hypothetical protein yc1106_04027 [Curvularia clavata]